MGNGAMRGSRFFIAGGAGFIGSHFTDFLLRQDEVERVTLYDNFSSGREWHYAPYAGDERLKVVRADVKDLPALKGAMAGHDSVIHLASNPDIARAVTEPDIDFREGTALTQNVVEAMRVTGAERLLYASGSGVYGDLGSMEAQEDHGPLMVSSTYGASKLAGEALIGSYCFMFGMTACAFRFGNVVGPRQTHGVGFDFVRRLAADPSRLRILGDGRQSKSYIHVEDVVCAVMTANERTVEPFRPYNVATGDYISVNEIALLAMEAAGIDPAGVTLEHAGGDRGWKGDVPVVRLNTDRIQGLGWRCRRKCREALLDAMLSMIEDNRRGRL
jgi:UDP-glucose 4-epimerase